MSIKKLTYVFAAAALAVGLQSPLARAVKQCDVGIPLNDFPCENANEKALGRAADISQGGAGTRYSHAVNRISGTVNAQGVLLDLSGVRTKKVGGGDCLRSSDTTLTGGYGTTQFCDPVTAFSAAKLRIVVD